MGRLKSTMQICPSCLFTEMFEDDETSDEENVSNPLIDASLEGNIQDVLKMLDAGMDINEVTESIWFDKMDEPGAYEQYTVSKII